jgi:CheY-like chemotaxis protein
LKSGLGSSVSLAIDVIPDTWDVVVDPGEFETALVNLVVNARDAMPDGGTVVITAGNMIGENLVAVSVADTGTGIPEDVAARIFDPFFTTKPIGKGTGLGLSQVHGFAHQAGGMVKLESALGKGTTITLCLPRSGSESRADQDTHSMEGAGTVLLVEDNPEVANASAGLLEQLGYRVRWVSDAPSALAEIEKDGIDIVFSDIVMPGKMDGLRLAKAIRARRPALPVLLATGYSETTATSGSEFPILRKPYQLHELSKELGKLIAK